MTLSLNAEWLHRLVNEAQRVEETTLPDASARHAIEERISRVMIPMNPLEELLVKSVAAKAYVETMAFRRSVSASATRRRGPAHIVRDLISREYPKRLTLGGIGRRLGLHPETLNRLFRKEFGRSVPEYVAALRVSEGVRRLRGDTDKVESIAREVGYRSKRAFYRAVQRETGLTPGQVRSWHEAPPRV